MEKVTVPNEIMLRDVSELVAEGREVEFLARGSSMLPFIRGDRDSVILTEAEAIHAGDIVLAMISPGVYVLHRVLSIQGDKVTLKGDGNLSGTEKCTVSDIKALAIKIVRPGGRESSCHSVRSMKAASRWNALPYFVRRCVLGFYHRALALGRKG